MFMVFHDHPIILHVSHFHFFSKQPSALSSFSSSAAPSPQVQFKTEESMLRPTDARTATSSEISTPSSASHRRSIIPLRKPQFAHLISEESSEYSAPPTPSIAPLSGNRVLEGPSLLSATATPSVARSLSVPEATSTPRISISSDIPLTVPRGYILTCKHGSLNSETLRKLPPSELYAVQNVYIENPGKGR